MVNELTDLLIRIRADKEFLESEVDSTSLELMYTHMSCIVTYVEQELVKIITGGLDEKD